MNKQNLVVGKPRVRARHVNGGRVERVTGGRASSSRTTRRTVLTHPLASTVTARHRVFFSVAFRRPAQLSIEGAAVVVSAISPVEQRVMSN